MCKKKRPHVCTGTTRTLVSRNPRDAGTHGDVLNVHTGRVEWTLGEGTGG